MDYNDVKINLRKYAFPLSTENALNQIQTVINGETTRKQHLNEDLAMDLISEFIFCETNEEGKPTKPMSRIRHLELLVMLCEYFNKTKIKHEIDNCCGDTSLNAIFMTLFPQFGAPPQRTNMLVSLVSLAITTYSNLILQSAGIQMQQLGCSSKYSLQLADGLVKKCFMFTSTKDIALKTLPQNAPLFTANLMTSLAELYFVTKPHDVVIKEPPRIVLETIVHWINSDPCLCFTAHYTDLQRALPCGAIPMAATLPIHGLFRWCFLAPLFVKNSDDLELYSELHCALIESVMQGWKVYSEQNQRVSRPYTMSTHTSVPPLLKEFIEDALKSDSQQLRNKVDIVIERLAQSIHAAIISDTIFGNKKMNVETPIKLLCLQEPSAVQQFF
ncbi:integrator complex subunit 15 isoform X2 [Daktulosphaira vitifoliae]|uniref:integrator complex subunit 15 isoform X2 n=1 Tax=Daktulosphaira vitifoliae TaxID=58002 RepID=UPI0021AA8F8E|nr:integrator complex subunit 15 isoform X2 [Daktulosphaira vitifoliae]